MNILYIFAILISFSSGERVAHIFLNAGQSNSEGYNSDGHTSEDVSYPNIWQLDCCSNGAMLPTDQCKFTTAQDPLHHQCDNWWLSNITVGYGMSFMRAFREEMPEDDLLIIVPGSISGTGYYDNVWTAYTGGGFKSAVSKIQQAYDLIIKEHKEFTPRFEGIVWQQGTHDAGDNAGGLFTNTTYYLYNEIIPMINAFRDKSVLPCTYPEVPFLCANLLPSWAANEQKPGRQGVFIAIALIDQLVPYTAVASSIGLVGDPAYPGAGGELLHFTAKSLRLLGKRYYSAYKLAKLNGPA